MEERKMCQGLQITFVSFRASEARHGIQYFELIMDTGYKDCALMSLRGSATTEAIS
ncbi:MAG: hypothetical protein ABSF13_03125 [Smithella sp.]|jgi:hypothetical protein